MAGGCSLTAQDPWHGSDRLAHFEEAKYLGGQVATRRYLELRWVHRDQASTVNLDTEGLCQCILPTLFFVLAAIVTDLAYRNGNYLNIHTTLAETLKNGLVLLIL